VILLGIVLGPAPIAAQVWNDAAARSLVARAVERRQNALADSSLRSFTARARGVVTFRAELGPDLGLLPRTVKADEIAVEVYWRRPDRSKQIIRSWRDTTLLPTGLNYHRDHLGIVTDDTGPTIRLGDGDEVADVVHPLAAEGPARYDYRLGDTVTIQSPSGRLVLIAIDVRPKDLGQPGVVGTLYLDRDRAQVVRSLFSFTPAAYRDRALEDIVVGLERSLIENRHWLPHGQTIEIRRRSPVVEFPLRGVIRGEWTIGDYQLNPDLEGVPWEGPSIGGLRRPGLGGDWSAPLAAVVDSSLRPRSHEEVAAIRAGAVRVARARLLDGLPRFGLAVSRVSEVFRFNRVQGLALGAGFAWRGGAVDRLGVGVGYGFSDQRVMGRIEASRALGGLGVRVRASRGIADFSDIEPISGLVNSLAAQVGGSDHGDYVLIERIEVAALRAAGPSRLSLAVAREWSATVASRATPVRGAFRPNPALGSPPQWTVSAKLEAGRSALRWEGLVRVSAEAGMAAASSYGRMAAFGHAARPAAGWVVRVRGMVGLATAATPARRSFAFGGVGTLVGEPFRGHGGRQAAWLATEWLATLPGPSLGLGWLGRTPPTVRVGPVVALGVAGGAIDHVPWRTTGTVPIVAGLAIELFDGSVRVEVGKSLISNRPAGLAIDLNRAWWPIL